MGDVMFPVQYVPFSNFAAHTSKQPGFNLINCHMVYVLIHRIYQMHHTYRHTYEQVPFVQYSSIALQMHYWLWKSLTE